MTLQRLYDIFVSLMIFGMRIGAFFNYKLKKGLAGRRQSCAIIKEKFNKTDRIIWMHAASLGEYEQGLPVLEKLKENFPEHKILITFFSPSGYENVAKKNTIADAVVYLPFDLKRWVREFTSNFQTDIFFTVKYDYWYNLLGILKQSGGKIYVVSALFYETQMFFGLSGKWFVKRLSEDVDWFFHQNKNSTALAKDIGLIKSSTAGDTRFDRVKQNLQRDNKVPFLREFLQNHQTLVIGSSWEAEDRIAEIVAEKNKDVKIVIAPHDLKRTATLKKTFPKAVLYSEILEIAKKYCDDCGEDLENAEIPSHVFPLSQVLIIDCIGLLSKIYSYADVAVVGGGFHSKGLHNILEAAVFSVPVVFGNHYTKNPEADALVERNGGKTFDDEFFAANFILEFLKHPEKISELGKNAGEFVASQPDATHLIVSKILSLQ